MADLKNSIKYLRLCLLLAAWVFVSCQNEDETAAGNDFKGFYEITAMQSEEPLDLNNDGIRSSNLYEEISGPFHTPGKDGPFVSFYRFDQRSSYAEVRPVFASQVDYPLLLLNLPLQEISYRTQAEPALSGYANDLCSYKYTLTGDSEVVLKLLTPDAVRLGVVSRLKRTDRDSFVVEMTARFFDFADSQWTYASITVFYERVEN